MEFQQQKQQHNRIGMRQRKKKFPDNICVSSQTMELASESIQGLGFLCDHPHERKTFLSFTVNGA